VLEPLLSQLAGVGTDPTWLEHARALWLARRGQVEASLDTLEAAQRLPPRATDPLRPAADPLRAVPHPQSGLAPLTSRLDAMTAEVIARPLWAAATARPLPPSIHRRARTFGWTLAGDRRAFRYLEAAQRADRPAALAAARDLWLHQPSLPFAALALAWEARLTPAAVSRGELDRAILAARHRGSVWLIRELTALRR
jgi:hypothetical protein